MIKWQVGMKVRRRVASEGTLYRALSHGVSTSLAVDEIPAQGQRLERGHTGPVRAAVVPPLMRSDASHMNMIPGLCETQKAGVHLRRYIRNSGAREYTHSRHVRNTAMS